MAAQQVPSVGSHLDFHRPLNAADLTPEQIADVTLRSRSFKSKDEAVRSIEAYFATTGHRVVRKSGGGIYHRYACTNHAAKNGNCPAHIAVRQEGQGEAAKFIVYITSLKHASNCIAQHGHVNGQAESQRTTIAPVDEENDSDESDVATPIEMHKDDKQRFNINDCLGFRLQHKCSPVRVMTYIQEVALASGVTLKLTSGPLIEQRLRCKTEGHASNCPFTIKIRFATSPSNSDKLLIRTRSCLVHVLASAQAGHDTSAADESRCAGVTGVVPSAPPVVTDTSSVSTVPTKVPVRIEGSGSNMLESASAGIKESASGATDCALLPTSPDSKVNRGDEEDIMHADDKSRFDINDCIGFKPRHPCSLRALRTHVCDNALKHGFHLWSFGSLKKRLPDLVCKHAKMTNPVHCPVIIRIRWDETLQTAYIKSNTILEHSAVCVGLYSDDALEGVKSMSKSAEQLKRKRSMHSEDSSEESDSDDEYVASEYRNANDSDSDSLEMYVSGERVRHKRARYSLRQFCQVQGSYADREESCAASSLSSSLSAADNLADNPERGEQQASPTITARRVEVSEIDRLAFQFVNAVGYTFQDCSATAIADFLQTHRCHPLGFTINKPDKRLKHIMRLNCKHASTGQMPPVRCPFVMVLKCVRGDKDLGKWQVDPETVVLHNAACEERYGRLPVDPKIKFAGEREASAVEPAHAAETVVSGVASVKTASSVPARQSLGTSSALGTASAQFRPTSIDGLPSTDPLKRDQLSLLGLEPRTPFFAPQDMGTSLLRSGPSQQQSIGHKMPQVSSYPVRAEVASAMAAGSSLAKLTTQSQPQPQIPQATAMTSLQTYQQKPQISALQTQQAVSSTPIEGLLFVGMESRLTDALYGSGLTSRSSLAGLDLTDYDGISGLIDGILSGNDFSDKDRNLAKLRILNDVDPLPFCIEISKLDQADLKLLHDHGLISLQTLLEGLQVDANGFIAAIVLAIVGDAKRLLSKRLIMKFRLDEAVRPYTQKAQAGSI